MQYMPCWKGNWVIKPIVESAAVQKSQIMENPRQKTYNEDEKLKSWRFSNQYQPNISVSLNFISYLFLIKIQILWLLIEFKSMKYSNFMNSENHNCSICRKEKLNLKHAKYHKFLISQVSNSYRRSFFRLNM